MSTSLHSPAPSDLHLGFLALLPRIEAHGRVYFRHVQCPVRREEAIAEMVALSWKWYLRLLEKGKQPAEFPSAIATFSARAVAAGRRLCGQERTEDVLSPFAQRIHGFAVSALPDYSTLSANPFSEALADNTVSPVPDQVAFRFDFPAWRATHGERDRRVLDDLMLGERTLDVSDKYGISPARVSQLRSEFKQDWERFCDVPAQGG